MLTLSLESRQQKVTIAPDFRAGAFHNVLMLRHASVAVAALCILAAPRLIAGGEPCLIETFAGGDTFSVGDGLPAAEAELFFPTDARLGPDGLLYIADSANHRIRRVAADGAMETFAGTGRPGSSPDGAPRLESMLNGPRKLAFGPDGSLYFSELATIRRIRPDGSVVNVAGNGDTAFSGDGGPAVEAGVQPRSFTVDSQGRVFVASPEQRRVRMIDLDGNISTVAGMEYDRSFNDAIGGPATEAKLGAPLDVAVGPDGLLYIASALDVLRILSDGTIETYISSNTGSRDATNRKEMRLQIFEVEASQTDLIYRSNLGIVQFDASDELVVLEPRAQLPTNHELAVQLDGRAFVINSSISEIRELTPDGQIAIAGAGVDSKRGDGGPATDALVSFPQRLDEGPDGSVYFLDLGLDNVRRVNPEGVISTVYAYDQAGGEASDLAVGPDGSLYIASRLLVRLTPGADPVVLAGLGVGPSFQDVISMDVDSQGNVYFLAGISSSIRYFYQLSPEGDIVTALTETFDSRPQHVYVDASDTVHIVGNRWHTFTPGGGLVRHESLEGFEQLPRAVAFAADQTLYLAPFDKLHKVDRIRPALIRDRIAGAEDAGFSAPAARPRMLASTS